jgi:hypothetical protein
MLVRGENRSEARAETAARVSAVLEQWENARSGLA